MDKYTPEAKAERQQFIDIKFQEGPIPEAGVNGAHIEDVIDLVTDRLEGFLSGPLADSDTEMAVAHLKMANAYLFERTKKRVEQGVEGTYNPHEG